MAFVIGWDEDNITVQYEGIAEELEGSEIEKYVSLYHKKAPEAADFKSIQSKHIGKLDLHGFAIQISMKSPEKYLKLTAKIG